jgi:hypothetical protein
MAYTDIDDPSDIFSTVLYTGTAASLAITNDGNSDLQGDLIWIKSRSTAWFHGLFAAGHGTGAGSGYKYLSSSSTAAVADTWGTITFGSDGFSGVSSGWNGSFAHDFGAAGNTFVSWHWKANGGTTTSQTGSDIDSVTQVNTDAKFSIVTYNGAANATADGSNNSGAYWRVKHGLGSIPKVAIFKSTSNVHGWYVWHHGFVGASKSDGDHIVLNSTSAMASNANQLWGSTEWSSTEFEIGGWDVINRSGKSYIGYLFDEVQGYSKFGSYVGNGNANGTFVYTGFKPAWVMCKSTASTSDWYIYDNKREGYNVDNDHLLANSTAVEATADEIDMLSNGFKLRIATDPNVAEAYIYMAFAEHPFVSSTGVPTTAR